MRQDSTFHTPQPSVSAALMAARHTAGPESAPQFGAHGGGARGMRFPSEDTGHSLAEMAQRDLDAALQLLVYRAQYITGAGGAAIALRRGERNDMLCLASSGEKAPKLGALLSTESGLSGESVRTRLPLRCDDAEHDARVNRENCRRLGIASVMIVPIFGEEPDRVDEVLRGDSPVLGVFELFSSQAGAFAERDLTALQRLGGMVETALRLAQAAQGLPLEIGTPDKISKDQNQPAKDQSQSTESQSQHQPRTTEGTEEHRGTAVLPPPEVMPAPVAVVPESIPVVAPPPANGQAVKLPPVNRPLVNRPLMWSAATVRANPASKVAETDQSHVPPMLRNLQKCKACGFPVSEGRTLCVECDEKQWRGQPLPSSAPKARAAEPAVDFKQGGVSGSTRDLSRSSEAKTNATAAPVTSALAASGTALAGRATTSAASAAARGKVAATTSSTSLSSDVSSDTSGNAAARRLAPQNLAEALAELREQEARVEASRRGVPVAIPPLVQEPAPSVTEAVPSEPVSSKQSLTEQSPAGTTAANVAQTSSAVLLSPALSARPTPAKTEQTQRGQSAPAGRAEPNPPSLNFTGGLETSDSWVGKNKYILGVIAAIAAAVGAAVWLR